MVHVRDMRFEEKTAIEKGVLSINRTELQEWILKDPRLLGVEIELARPGERCRILKVLDVVEPRAKQGEGDRDFPGAGGKFATVGQGATCVLRNAAVVICDYREVREISTSSDPNGEIIDMSGPGAEASEFGKTHNVVLLATPAARVGTREYMAALKVAGLKTAAYLARAGKGVPPDETEVYELPPLTGTGQTPDSLPRVVYIFQIQTLQFEPISGEPVLYGRNVHDIVPTLLHPNEVFDGALTSPLPALNVQTYHVQNHPIIRELYKRHGKDLRFCGVIATIAPSNLPDNERLSHMAASLARNIVGADGAVLTKIGGGAPELSLAMTAQCCERLGIRTAMAMLHMGADIRDVKHGAFTIFNMPEVDAIVSMGFPFTELRLPAVDRVIGRPGVSPEGEVHGETSRHIRWIKGSQCQLGGSRLRAIRY
jgi:glycine reductase